MQINGLFHLSCDSFANIGDEYYKQTTVCIVWRCFHSLFMVAYIQHKYTTQITAASINIDLLSFVLFLQLSVQYYINQSVVQAMASLVLQFIIMSYSQLLIFNDVYMAALTSKVLYRPNQFMSLSCK